MITKDQILYWLPVFYDAYFGKKGIYVIGYTKSGTNWLKNMLRHYYGFELTPKYVPGQPFFGARAYHLHRFIKSSYFKKSSIYIVRDGRDTVVSRYFTMVNQKSQQLMKQDFIKFCGKEPTKDNIKELLPDYITFLINYHKSTIDYKSHVCEAIYNNYFIVKYEDLHNDTYITLRSCINYLTPRERMDDIKINDAIEYCSLEASKKRQKIDTGFFRKGGGKTGDWRNYFTKKSALAYENYAGEILIKLGYEDNDNWINEF